jgi:hypothetical protein
MDKRTAESIHEQAIELLKKTFPENGYISTIDYRTLFGSSRVKETGIGESSFKK